MNNPMCDRSHVGLLQVFKSGGSSSGLFAAKEVLGPSDMQLGAVITVFSRGFELSEADEHTLKHMEQNSEEYPHSSIDKARGRGGGRGAFKPVKCLYKCGTSALIGCPAT